MNPGRRLVRALLRTPALRAGGSAAAQDSNITRPIDELERLLAAEPW